MQKMRISGTGIKVAVHIIKIFIAKKTINIVALSNKV